MRNEATPRVCAAGRSAGSRSRAAYCWLLALALVVFIHLSTVSSPAYATQTCDLSASGQACTNPGPPTDLLGPSALAAATPDQAAALRRLSAKAVDNVMTEHDLHATDRDEVLGWARSDAQAELFALIFKAADTAAADRTSDQQLAVGWLNGLARAQADEVAQDAGAEYAKWDGLDVKTYWRLVDDPTTTESTLTAFLSDTSNSGAGSCHYTPPSPDQGQYDGSKASICYTPCFSGMGCLPHPPSYDDFVAWGKAAYADDMSTNTDYAWADSAIAAVAGFGTAAGAMLAAVNGVTIELTTEALYEVAQAARAFFNTSQSLAESISFGSWYAAEKASEVAQATVTASEIGVAVTVISAVVTIVLESIRVSDEVAVPGKLASLVIGTRTATPDLATLLNNSQDAAGVYALLVQATLPLPRVGGACDGTKAVTDNGTRPCLNPPPVPAPSPRDPTFDVVDLTTGARTSSPQITVESPTGTHTATVRVSGNWFVTHDAGADSEVPSFGISYRDADDSWQQIWLVRDLSGGYIFAGICGDAAAWGSDGWLGHCPNRKFLWSSRTLRYLGPDGDTYVASLEPATEPVGTPSIDPEASKTAPTEGSPVTFRSGDFRPGNSVGQLTYTWRFQHDGCPTPCTTVTTSGPGGGLAGGPAYGDPLTGRAANGDRPTHTWRSSGTFTVEVTATDAMGHHATTTFPVTVAGVPPVLALDTPDSSPDAGQAVTVTGTVGHAGTLDDERVTVDWGDASPVDRVDGGPNSLAMAGSRLTLVPHSDTQLELRATHTYPTPGTYRARVTVIDEAGHTDAETVTVVVP